jgi:hypothetical protein
VSVFVLNTDCGSKLCVSGNGDHMVLAVQVPTTRVGPNGETTTHLSEFKAFRLSAEQVEELCMALWEASRG